jgi:hypothetical protein
MLLSKAYYTFKFLVPRRLQIQLRRYYVNRKRLQYADIWPIDPNAANPRQYEGKAGTTYFLPKKRDSSRFSREKIGSCPGFSGHRLELIIGSCPPFFSMEPKQRHLGRWQKPSRIMPAVSIEK